MAGQVGKRKAKMVNEPNDKLRSEMSDRIKEGGGFARLVCVMGSACRSEGVIQPHQSPWRSPGVPTDCVLWRSWQLKGWSWRRLDSH